jgi:hypothetical protein
MNENLPESLQLNAWTSEDSAHGDLADGAAKWGARPGLPHSQQPLPFAPPVDPKDWAHQSVGYGILLPDIDDPHLSIAARAAGEDAPPPVRELLAARPDTAVLRWRPELGSRLVRRYFADGTTQDPTIGLTNFGLGKGQLPRYIVIIGGPDVIPWSLQYELGTRHAVGRIPLAGEQLGNYLTAMLSGWADADFDVGTALMWSVDHGGGDITAEMRAVIANPLAAALKPPPLARFDHLTDGHATGPDLVKGLSAARPGLLVTSSHGCTGPLGDADAMRANLGLPVDVQHRMVPLADLDAGIPGGAVWYAQACCSAGGDDQSHYRGLLQEGTTAFGVVSAVAALGRSVAPAALRLLGRKRPIRAVYGHVEPTFNWTLRIPETGQGLGHHIVAALSSNLYHQQPLGLTFADYRAGVGELHTQWASLHQRLADGDTSVRETLTRLRLTALDRQSLVLLGDPTVTMPALPALGG